MSAICGECGGELIGYGADANCPFCDLAALRCQSGRLRQPAVSILPENPPRQRHAGVPRPLVLQAQVLAAPAYDTEGEIERKRQMKYVALVELTGYDQIAVEADSPQLAENAVHTILKDEQRYGSPKFRPLLGVIKMIQSVEEDVQIVWRRGEDPLKKLLVNEKEST